VHFQFAGAAGKLAGLGKTLRSSSSSGASSDGGVSERASSSICSVNRWMRCVSRVSAVLSESRNSGLLISASKSCWCVVSGTSELRISWRSGAQ